MSDYQIVTDGSCDLSDEKVKENDIIVVPFYVAFQKEEYLKEKVDVGIRDFYQQMVDNPNVFPKTSMPTAADYYEVFEKLVTAGKKVLCLCITTKFSGSFNSANVAKSSILEKYPKARIEVVDTIVNTVLQGLLVQEVVCMQRNGLTLEQALTEIERIKQTGRIFFTVNGLDYLRHGGRIGKVTALIGNVLKINPLINLREGEIFSCGFSISRKRALIKVKEIAMEHLTKIKANPMDYRIAVGYGYDKQEAQVFLEKLAGLLMIDPNDIELSQIGATIAVHTGPFPIGIGIIKKYDH